MRALGAVAALVWLAFGVRRLVAGRHRSPLGTLHDVLAALVPLVVGAGVLVVVLGAETLGAFIVMAALPLAVARLVLAARAR